MPAKAQGLKFHDVVIDTQGNTYVTGLFSNSIQLSSYQLTAQNDDVFVAKLTKQATWSWAKVAGSSSPDKYPNLGLDGNNRLMLSALFGTQVDFFRDQASTSKKLFNGGSHSCTGNITNDGIVNWAVCLGGGRASSQRSESQVGDLHTLPSGDSWLTFSMYRATDLRCDGQNILPRDDPQSGFGTTAGVVRLDAQGKCKWARSMGAKLFQEKTLPARITVDSEQNVYVTGTFLGTAHFGTSSLRSRGKEDVYITKLSPSGEFQWVNSLGGIQKDDISGITHSKESLYIAGTFEGTATLGTIVLSSSLDRDIFVAKLKNTGDVAWATSLGGRKTNETVAGLGTTPDGFLYVAGTFSQQTTLGDTTLQSLGGHDIYLAKLGPWGRVHWVEQAGGSGDEKVNNLVIGPKGIIHLLGSFQSPTATFGNIQATHPNQDGSPHPFLWMVQP